MLHVDHAGATHPENSIDLDEAEELFDSALELIQLADIINSQRKTAEAVELYEDAYDRLLEYAGLGEKAPNSKEAREKITLCQHFLLTLDPGRDFTADNQALERNQAQASIEQSKRRSTANMVTTGPVTREHAENLCSMAEAAKKLNDFDTAKDHYIDAVDIFMTLEQTCSREEKSEISARLISILYLAEDMKKLAEKTGQQTAPRRRSSGTLEGVLNKRRSSGRVKTPLDRIIRRSSLLGEAESKDEGRPTATSVRRASQLQNIAEDEQQEVKEEEEDDIMKALSTAMDISDSATRSKLSFQSIGVASDISRESFQMCDPPSGKSSTMSFPARDSDQSNERSKSFADRESGLSTEHQQRQPPVCVVEDEQGIKKAADSNSPRLSPAMRKNFGKQRPFSSFEPRGSHENQASEQRTRSGTGSFDSRTTSTSEQKPNLHRLGRHNASKISRGRSKTFALPEQPPLQQSRSRTRSLLPGKSIPGLMAMLGNSMAISNTKINLEALENKLSDMADKEVSFPTCVHLEISDTEYVMNMPPNEKKALLPLLANAVPQIAAASPLKVITIKSLELRVDSGLQESQFVAALNFLPHLMTVNLSGCGITAAGCTSLAQSLVANQSIVTLNLADNQIGDEGATALATILLRRTTALRQLGLRNNNIGSAGADAVAHSASKRTSLFQLDLQENLVGCETIDKFTPVCHKTMMHVHFSEQHHKQKCKGHSEDKFIEIHSTGLQRFEDSSGQRRRKSFTNTLRKTLRGKQKEGEEGQHVSTTADGLSCAEMISDFGVALENILMPVTIPNILIVGPNGVGKTTLANNLAVGGVIQMRPDLHATRFESNTIQIWDYTRTMSRKTDGEILDDSHALQYLLLSLNSSQDKLSHVHIIWCMFDRVTFSRDSQDFLGDVFRRAAEVNVPIVIILNKAECHPPEATKKFKTTIENLVGEDPMYLGFYTTIANPGPLEEQYQLKLKVEGLNSERVAEVSKQRIERLLADHHQLEGLLMETANHLPRPARRSMLTKQISSLSSRQMASAEILKGAYVKFEKAKTRLTIRSTARRGTALLGKMMRKLAFVWGFVRAESDAEQDSFLTQDIKLEDIGGNRDESVTFSAVGVLWTLYLQFYVLKFLQHAQNHTTPEFGDHVAIGLAVNGFHSGLSAVSQVADLLEKHLEDSHEEDSITVAFLRTFVKGERYLIRPANIASDEGASLTMLEQLINIISNPNEPLDTRDGFFCSYRQTLKSTPLEVFEAFKSIFIVNIKEGGRSNRKICATVVKCLTHWVENFLEDDFFEKEDIPSHEDCGDGDIMLDHFMPIYWEDRNMSWINELYSFGGISLIVVKFMQLADHARIEGMPELADELENAMKSSIETQASGMQDPSTLPELSFKPVAQFDAFLIAAQLTYLDFGMFKSMSVRDFFARESAKRSAMIHQANLYAYWVVQTIVDEPILKERAKTLKKLMEVALALQASPLNNLSGFMAIMTGLQMSHILRLKKTWTAIEDEHPLLFKRFNEECKTLSDPGNGIYNNVLERIVGPKALSPPCVPFLGSFLTAIERTKTQGGAKGSNDTAAAARIQGDVAAAQQKLLKRIPMLKKGVYEWDSFNLVPRFDSFLREELDQMFDLSDRKQRDAVEDTLNKLSLKCEPRESRPRPNSGSTC